MRRRLLIAEDMEINRMLLGQILQDEYDLLFAADGAETLQQLQEHKGSLSLLLDLQMPVLGGMEVLRTMKESPDLCNIPVVVLTGDQSAEVACLQLGAIDFIPKPYPGAEIIRARVHKCIELTENREIIQSTERDRLTHLYTYEYFLRYVETYDRHSEGRPMDALVVDINRFQLINERYGKQYGDVILQRLADRIRTAARAVGGVSCRRSGDSFYLYCPHLDSYEDLVPLFSEGLSGENTEADRVSLRIGVYPNVDRSLEIERRFDRAKKAADTLRGSRVQSVSLYDEALHAAQMHRERLLEDFRPSLDRKDFRVYLQPKYDVRPEKPVLASAEALVRWVHPSLGLISPADFIPLLEESGLILELDSYVWRETAALIRGWKDRLGISVPVSVNVSRIDMLSSDIQGIFRQILTDYRLTPDGLILEITESAYTGNAEQVISVVNNLRGPELGFRIEMDDFGTGYSSLGMLTHLPIDALKLDMSFVRSAFRGTRDVRMIRLIIDIAEYLGVPVIAEGVETEEQMRTLREMGCDLVQGYYFSRPVPPEDFEKFFETR